MSFFINCGPNESMSIFEYCGPNEALVISGKQAHYENSYTLVWVTSNFSSKVHWNSLKREISRKKIKFVDFLTLYNIHINF